MTKNIKTKIIGVSILTFLILIFIFIFYREREKSLAIEISPPDVPANTTEKQTESKLANTTLEINGVKYEENIEKEISVYDFMSKMRKEGKIDFTEKNYTGIGKFIESINGIKGDRNKTWIYYVNGKEAEVGVSNYKIKKGDIVSFKYEKSY